MSIRLDVISRKINKAARSKIGKDCEMRNERSIIAEWTQIEKQRVGGPQEKWRSAGEKMKNERDLLRSSGKMLKQETTIKLS